VSNLSKGQRRASSPGWFIATAFDSSRRLAGYCNGFHRKTAPKSSGYDTILVVVDRFSKYAHFIAMKHPFTATQVAQVVLDQVVRLHDLPRSIVSDRDKIFTSIFWSQLFKLLGTKLNLSTTYYPQTDGQSERVNQCVEMYLRCAVHAQPSKWKNWLPLAEFLYNTTYHTSLACSPFKVLYGYDPPFAAAPHIPSDAIVDVAQLLTERAQFTLMLREQLAAAQNRMKLKVDRLRTERQFNVSDMVLLKLQPYTQNTVVSRPCPKLAFKFFGPYKILERVGAVAYRLELPAGAQAHPVFHVSQLKPYIPDYTPVFATLPNSSDLSGHNVQPLEILDHRLIKKGNRAVPQVLVRWSHVLVDATTWEDYYVLRQRYPDALAWGQASVAGGQMSRQRVP
jgi:hypothetical protein